MNSGSSKRMLAWIFPRDRDCNWCAEEISICEESNNHIMECQKIICSPDSQRCVQQLEQKQSPVLPKYLAKLEMHDTITPCSCNFVWGIWAVHTFALHTIIALRTVNFASGQSDLIPHSGSPSVSTNVSLLYIMTPPWVIKESIGQMMAMLTQCLFACNENSISNTDMCQAFTCIRNRSQICWSAKIGQ